MQQFHVLMDTKEKPNAFDDCARTEMMENLKTSRPNRISIITFQFNFNLSHDSDPAECLVFCLSITMRLCGMVLHSRTLAD